MGDTFEMDRISNLDWLVVGLYLTGLIGLSSYHINDVVKRFMKVAKTASTNDVLGKMKKILGQEKVSYWHHFFLC